MPSSIQGTGTTIVFANAGITFAGRFRQIGGLSRSLPVLDDTALSSTGYMEKIPGDLKDLSPMSCEIYSDASKEVNMGLIGLVTITFQPPAGLTNGAKLTFTGFINESDTGSVEANVTKMETLSIQPDGKATKPTWTAAT